jgi:small subunit ribosomal protein S9
MGKLRKRSREESDELTKASSEGIYTSKTEKIPAQTYFAYNPLYLRHLTDPFIAAGLDPKQYALEIRVKGGGLMGQAQAVGLATARAVKNHRMATTESQEVSTGVADTSRSSGEIQGTQQHSTVTSSLRSEGLLTRDSRRKERKKFGRKKARKKPQFSKR